MMFNGLYEFLFEDFEFSVTFDLSSAAVVATAGKPRLSALERWKRQRLRTHKSKVMAILNGELWFLKFGKIKNY